MRAALDQAGVPTIRQGDVYRIPDSVVHFAESNTASRTMHQDRYVVVMQDDGHAANANCPSVLVALMSSQIQNKRAWEYELAAGLGGQPFASLVKLHLIQPVPRTAIEQGTWVGSVPAQKLEEIIAILLHNLGVV